MDFIFRIAILGFGYIYPAYKCFKALDGRPKVEQLYSWCQYWIIIAIFTGIERVADTFISWIPFYSGGKLAFIIYLCHPTGKGTDHIFTTYVKPLISEHAQNVDWNLVHIRDRLLPLFNQILIFAQAKIFELTHQRNLRVPLQTPSASNTLSVRQVRGSKPNYVQPGKMLPGQQHYSTYQPLTESVSYQAGHIPGHRQQVQIQSGHFSELQHPQPQKQTAPNAVAQTVVPPQDKEDAEFEFLHIPAGAADSTKPNSKVNPSHTQGLFSRLWKQSSTTS